MSDELHIGLAVVGIAGSLVSLVLSLWALHLTRRVRRDLAELERQREAHYDPHGYPPL